MNRASNRALAPLGISAEQAHILAVLWLEGPKKIGELQRTLTLSSGTLTGAVDRMEQAGLVRRRADERDGRAFVVETARLSPKRRREVESTLEGIERDCFSALTRRERADLLALLEKVGISPSESSRARSAEPPAARRTTRRPLPRRRRSRA